MPPALTIVLIVLAVIVVVFILIVARQPSQFSVSRSAAISAPVADVFAEVNDFHKWNAWSPWAKIDPAAKNEFSGAPAGKGAIFSWSGNNKVGEGTMTIVDSRPPDLIRIKLEFRRPFKATNDVEFTFQPERTQTAVTWTMTGRSNFMHKAVCLFMNMDKMVGGDFEKGLASMKAVAEGSRG